MNNVTPGLTGRALGEAVIDYVLSHPEQHDQDDFACGTTACLAGWTICLHEQVEPEAHRILPAREVGLVDWTILHTSASNRAADLLGVSQVRFREAVYEEFDHDAAISNFKHLLDETYSEAVQ